MLGENTAAGAFPENTPGSVPSRTSVPAQKLFFPSKVCENSPLLWHPGRKFSEFSGWPGENADAVHTLSSHRKTRQKIPCTPRGRRKRYRPLPFLPATISAAWRFPASSRWNGDYTDRKQKTHFSGKHTRSPQQTRTLRHRHSTAY